MRDVVVLLTEILLLVAGTLPLHAQSTATLRGRVVDSAGAAVDGAQVALDGTSIGTLTNTSGRYLIPGVPSGTYTVRVQAIGYATQEATVTLAAGASVERNFTLAEEAIALQELTVTVGSRAAHTAADELAVPVDVFPMRDIQGSTPQLEMASVLEELSPSIYFPRAQIADNTSGVRPFQLRGLSPDHSLVLINGKRRHPTAVVHVFGASSGGSGSSGVDMNAIAMPAVGAMEVLRDGAAAQYGSDAIAGVINLQLRSDVHAPEFSVSLGQYMPDNFEPDGQRLEFTGSWGLALGDRGTLNLSAAISDRNRTHRAGPDARDQLCQGDPDITGDCDGDIIEDIDGDGVGEVVEKRNPVPQPNHLIGDGRSNNYQLFWNADYALGEEGHRLYAFGGYSFRRDIHSGFFRRGADPDGRNWLEIHPFGFLPKFRGDTRDLMMVGGLEGRLGEWSYDVSGQWGRNVYELDIFDSHNASLGPCLDVPCAPGRDGIPGTDDDPGIPNKTDMYAGTLILNQPVLGLDLVRQVDIGRASPLNVALGTAYRGDNYQVHAGEPASWINGWHPDMFGNVAAPGAQVFTGFRPDQEADAWRHSFAGYLDLETDLTDSFLMAGAVRYEWYNDFGNTLTGKLAARLQPLEQLVLRGAVSTGFRAPNLSQSYYAHVSTGFRSDPDNPGNQIAYEIGEIPVNSPEARALGAEPLQEETSVNLSAGLAFSPTDELTFTVDGYRIDVKDRVILSGSLGGPTVEALLSEFGAPTVKFFTNAVDTRTRGVDVSARYRFLFSDDRFLESIFQYNWNELEVTDVHVPDVISEIEDQVFDSGDRYSLENGRPDDRFTLRNRYTHGPFRAGITVNWYGVQTFRLEEGSGGQPDVFFENGPHTVFDGELSYEVLSGLTVSVGAENMFDRNPPTRPDGYDFLGIFPFYSSSGLSMNGRYVWTRLRVSAPF